MSIDDVQKTHQDLGWLLMSTGWNDVMKPAVVERAKSLTSRLLDPSAQRKDRLPDDYIRGQIAALRWLIEWPEKEMQQAAVAMNAAEEMRQAQGGTTPH